jgi:hypothetical protein
VHRRREGLTTRGEMAEIPSPVCDELEVDAELRRNFEGRETKDESASSVKT